MSYICNIQFLWLSKPIVNLCNNFIKNPKVFQKNADIYITEDKRHFGKDKKDMLKKITTPSNNTFSGVEFILRGAKKRRTMAVSNAVAINAESGVQTKLQAVK